MSFPASPTNGQLATVNQIIYQYNSSARSWTRIVAGVNTLTANALTILSNISIGNRGVPTSFVGNTAPTTPAPVIGDLWYYPPTDKTFRYNYDGTSYQWIDTGSPTAIVFTGVSVTANTVTSASFLPTSNATANIGSSSLQFNTLFATTVTSSNFLPTANGTSNIGSTSSQFNTVFAKATSAQYADLAEKYTSDNLYKPGTVVVFGGEQEITTSSISHDPRVAGIISTDPAYLMNSDATGLEVALTGRVPCYVVGKINKGDRLVNSDISGVATVLDMTKYEPGCIIGKSLESYNSSEVGTIEVVVGRH
jgi:hypothetical protein